MRLGYIFRGGRKSRWQQVIQRQAPSEFFYGADYMANNGADVKILECDGSVGSTRIGDRIESSAMGRLCVGPRLAQVRALQKEIEGNEWAIGVPDSVAIALGALRRQGAISCRCAGFLMGLGDKISNASSKWYGGLVREYYEKALAGLDWIFCLGQPEADYLKKLYPSLADRIFFIPFGIDTTFWAGERVESDRPFVLFVGNDPNRDFQKVREIAAAMPETHFRIVSSKMKPTGLANISFTNGDWGDKVLTDQAMRDLYLSASAVILPLKETLQPSGQSVCLQAMSCGAPVVMTRTKGLWQDGVLQDNENCRLLDPSASVMEWKRVLYDILSSKNIRDRLGGNGQRTVSVEWTSTKFASRVDAFLARSFSPVEKK